MSANRVTNVVVAGLGGQGVLRASDILSSVVFGTGMDVKKSEVHGMSQRGGSVCSDIRFGAEVFSPMVPPGEADFLVVLASDWIHVHKDRLRPGGVLIDPSCIDSTQLGSPKALNVALLGVLSAYLDLPEAAWLGAMRASLPEKLHQLNERAFALGRAAGTHTRSEAGRP